MKRKLWFNKHQHDIDRIIWFHVRCSVEEVLNTAVGRGLNFAGKIVNKVHQDVSDVVLK